MNSLSKKAQKNYLNFRHSDWIGGNPIYAPLLEWLRKNNSAYSDKTRIYARMPILQKTTDYNSILSSTIINDFLADIIVRVTGIEKQVFSEMIDRKDKKTLQILKNGHGRRLYSFLKLDSRKDDFWDNTADLLKTYQGILKYCRSISPRIRGLNSVLSELDRKLQFYRQIDSGKYSLRYQTFPFSPMEILVQPSIDCCLFNGQSRHRAATVAFLVHPAIKLMALYDTRRRKVYGATIEADMLNENGAPVRILDSVEMGDYRNDLTIHYGWKRLTVLGIIQRYYQDYNRQGTIFFNTGFEPTFNQGYLSHVAANELAEWLKERFPVIKLPLKLKYGLEPLKRLGAINPEINLEILSTKKMNNMFNKGVGTGIGIRIDPWNSEHLEKLGISNFASKYPVSQG